MARVVKQAGEWSAQMWKPGDGRTIHELIPERKLAKMGSEDLRRLLMLRWMK